MKPLLAIAIALIASAPAAIAQTKTSSDKALESRIIALDKQGWEAWKNNDPNWFKTNTTDSFVSISSDGINTKTEVVKSISTDCKVASFSLANFKFYRLDTNAVLLTYTATQDAICGGKKAPATLQVAVNYVSRGGKWLEAMYMQAP
ncbi:MAG: nuclear transport factor 2 family protein [Betaproteobacteria bacterium]